MVKQNDTVTGASEINDADLELVAGGACTDTKGILWATDEHAEVKPGVWAVCMANGTWSPL